MIEKADSISLALATIAILGQAPRGSRTALKVLIDTCKLRRFRLVLKSLRGNLNSYECRAESLL